MLLYTVSRRHHFEDYRLTHQSHLVPENIFPHLGLINAFVVMFQCILFLSVSFNSQLFRFGHFHYVFDPQDGSLELDSRYGCTEPFESDIFDSRDAADTCGVIYELSASSDEALTIASVKIGGRKTYRKTNMSVVLLHLAEALASVSCHAMLQTLLQRPHFRHN